ncbi:hypothetical protein, conserved [Eimeria maxima]|uniref:Uncharacterized protein n=1 Tax=Eimeria maxima TaxID=5804 RepID=U6M5Y3_EIMMA|nr:hypothetical protein, conserved [Eimeria maxima]CDJ59446.1 hypothetical protein, conserved [Eimeria maxima]
MGCRLGTHVWDPESASRLQGGGGAVASLRGILKMAKKKGKGKGPAQKVDVAKLQEEARLQHIEESTTLVLQKAGLPQKELLEGWIEEAVEIKKRLEQPKIQKKENPSSQNS